ncbi:MAG: transposase family protein [Janthinobacterium lividum]
MVLCLVSYSLPTIVPGSLDVLRVLPTPDHVTVEAELRSIRATCPGCGSLSRRLHSRYPPVLRDLPWQRRPATIRVPARRFRCLTTTRDRKDVR